MSFGYPVQEPDNDYKTIQQNRENPIDALSKEKADYLNRVSSYIESLERENDAAGVVIEQNNAAIKKLKELIDR